MKRTLPSSSLWTLKSPQEISVFLSTYTGRSEQPLPTTLKKYLDLLTDSSNEPAVRYLRRSHYGLLGAIWRAAFLMTAPLALGGALALTLKLNTLLSVALAGLLSLAVVLGPPLHARKQLSRLYYIDVDRITRDFKNVLRPLIRQYNRNIKAGHLSTHDDRALLAVSIFDFQTLYPFSPQAPLPERDPMPWDAPDNPYQPSFVTLVLEDRRSPGMHHMFEQGNHQKPLYTVSLRLDRIFTSPLLKVSVVYLLTVLLFSLNHIVRFPPLTTEKLGVYLLAGLLGPVLFYARAMKVIPYLMQSPINYYGPSGSTQSITVWSLYKAFRRELLPSVKAARKNLISPLELEQTYTQFRARYPLTVSNPHTESGGHLAGAKL